MQGYEGVISTMLDVLSGKMKPGEIREPIPGLQLESPDADRLIIRDTRTGQESEWDISALLAA